MSVRAVDPVELAIFRSGVHSIAEEMGAALRRTALSPNIKERRDYSCAIFDGEARVIAMGDHMPVHLGSMPMSVAAAVAAIRFARGDIAVLNDPYAGGTHLPDITMVLPVFPAGAINRPFMFRLEPTTPMLAALFLVRWGQRAKSTRKESAFLLCASCAAARSIAKCWT